MPNISTHLHLALKLSEKIHIENKTLFFLGTAYPDCWRNSEEEAKRRHSEVDTEKNDFNWGHEFHLWVDDCMKDVNTGDISKYDCMICDMPVIAPIIEELRRGNFEGREADAMANILTLETEPLPLYLVPDAKRERYEEILDSLVEKFYITYREKQLDCGQEVLDNEQNRLNN